MKQVYKNIIFFLAVILIFEKVKAQNSNKLIPRDTSYGIMRQYKKYLKYYPEITPGKDSLPANVKENRNLVYTTIKNTPYAIKIYILMYSHLNTKENIQL